MPSPTRRCLVVLDASAPIGVFDSGLGGISVLAEIRRRLPGEDLVYVADSAHVPYGGHTASFIVSRSLALSNFLLGEGAKAIVVACNTATAAAVPVLRARLTVPIVGMEPAVKPAAAATRSGVVGVLATVGTLRSARFAALLERFGERIRVVTEPCPGLVERVERGALDDRTTRGLVRRHLAPLLAARADVVILGCTHYAFLRPVIEEEAGPGVTVIDTGDAVARQLERRLAELSLMRSADAPGGTRFLTSGPIEALDAVLPVLWSGTATTTRLPA
jgi:glutamate racemase